jgi:hypothetical protein
MGGHCRQHERSHSAHDGELSDMCHMNYPPFTAGASEVRSGVAGFAKWTYERSPEISLATVVVPSCSGERHHQANGTDPDQKTSKPSRAEAGSGAGELSVRETFAVGPSSRAYG